MEKQVFQLKSKLGFTIFFIISFLLGIFLLIDGETLMYGLIFIGAAIFYFILFAPAIARKPGLIISDDGITNNTVMGAKSYHIAWSEIDTFRYKSVKNLEAIFIYLKDPVKFIENQSGTMNKIDMSSRWKNYGTPVTILVKHVQNQEKIMELLKERIEIKPVG